MSDNALVQLDAARMALAECKTVMEAKQIADVAEAARVYLERTNASVATVNQATEVRLLAERQMGEFLASMPKAPAGRPAKEIGSREEPINERPATLAEIGITKKQSARAQKLAAIPADEFEQRVEAAKDEGKLTVAAVVAPKAAPVEVSPGIVIVDTHAPSRRVATTFNFSEWCAQTQTLVGFRVSAVPAKHRAEAIKFLAQLITEIGEQNKK